MGNVLLMTLGFVGVVIWGSSLGNNDKYFFWACGFTIITLVYGNYSGDISSNSNIDNNAGYDSDKNWPREQENKSSVCYYEDGGQDCWKDDSHVWDNDGGRSSWNNNRIYDSRGFAINGKLLEYYRQVRKTGIADTEYELELKDGYRYCNKHEEYDDCHYGHDDDSYESDDSCDNCDDN